MSAETAFEAAKALGCPNVRGDVVSMVRCPLPTHGRGLGDRHPSLSVKLGHKGLVLRCGCGCPAWAIVAHVGFELRDLFYDNREPRRSDLAELEARFKRGELKLPRLHVTRDEGLTANGFFPYNVSSDIVSCDMGPAGRRVLEDLALLVRLGAAAGDMRPVPYAVRFCASRMGWPGEAGYRRASRVLAMLAESGYLVCAGTLASRGRRWGTKCYQLTERAALLLGLEFGFALDATGETVPVPAPHEDVPVQEGLMVDSAAVGTREDPFAVAAGDGALAGDGNVGVGAGWVQGEPPLVDDSTDDDTGPDDAEGLER